MPSLCYKLYLGKKKAMQKVVGPLTRFGVCSYVLASNKNKHVVEIESDFFFCHRRQKVTSKTNPGNRNLTWGRRPFAFVPGPRSQLSKALLTMVILWLCLDRNVCMCVCVSLYLWPLTAHMPTSPLLLLSYTGQSVKVSLFLQHRRIDRSRTSS